MVLHCLNYEIFAVVVLLEQRLAVNLIKRDSYPWIRFVNIRLTNLVNEIILTEQGQSDVLHERRQVLSSGFCWVLDPGDDTFKHLKVMKFGWEKGFIIRTCGHNLHKIRPTAKGSGDQNYHLLLVGHGDGVAGNEGGDLVWTETVELVTLEHLKQLIWHILHLHLIGFRKEHNKWSLPL